MQTLSLPAKYPKSSVNANPVTIPHSDTRFPGLTIPHSDTHFSGLYPNHVLTSLGYTPIMYSLPWAIPQSCTHFSGLYPNHVLTSLGSLYPIQTLTSLDYTPLSSLGSLYPLKQFTGLTIPHSDSCWMSCLQSPLTCQTKGKEARLGQRAPRRHLAWAGPRSIVSTSWIQIWSIFKRKKRLTSTHAHFPLFYATMLIIFRICSDTCDTQIKSLIKYLWCKVMTVAEGRHPTQKAKMGKPGMWQRWSDKVLKENNHNHETTADAGTRTKMRKERESERESGIYIQITSTHNW